jgi:tripartite-type tricarboxylate transporter receptor subunit TctC
MKKILLSVLFFVFSATTSATEFTVMHSPGGVSDLVTRFLANGMEGETRYAVINRPGGAGRIAMNHLFREDTILLATMVQVFVTNPINFKDLEYDPHRDLDIIATVGIMPSALVCNTKTNFQTFQDFKNSNNSLTFGVGGYGSSEHIATEVLNSTVKNKHKIIPYANGGSTSVSDLLGGHIDCMFANFPTIRSHLTSKNLVVLMTSHNVGLSVDTWEDNYGSAFPFQSFLSVVASKKMNIDKKKTIQDDLNKFINKEDYNVSLKKLGIFPKSSTMKKDIDIVIENNKQIKQFIVNNDIKTSK